MTNSTVVTKERCPACAANGKDKHGDNLAVYSDGHKYCFSCGYYIPSSGNIIQRKQETKEIQPKTTITLPFDIERELPKEARDWLDQFNITKLDISKNHIFWSEHYSRIIFPYFGNDGSILGYQGRLIGKQEGPKWWSQGALNELIHTINVRDHAVIVEDIVSAIRVGHSTGAIPLFGSHLSKLKALRLKYIVNSISIWLDPDKAKESIKMAETCKMLGLETNVILSDQDPKYYSNDDIKKFIQL